jgi:hypothetical protein
LWFFNFFEKRMENDKFPYKKILAVLFLLCVDSLFDSSLFPYLPQLTCDLLNLDEKKDAKLVGYYAGVIGSSYYITQLISAYQHFT